MTRKTIKREGKNSGGEAAAVFPLFSPFGVAISPAGGGQGGRYLPKLRNPKPETPLRLRSGG